MCLYKIVHMRAHRKPWMSRDLYALIHERKCLLKQYILNKVPNLLQDLRKLRNRVNASVDKAKAVYINDLLKSTHKNLIMFWRNIKSLRGGDIIQEENSIFKNPSSGRKIAKEDTANFISEYFANIGQRVCNENGFRVYVPGIE